MALACVGPSASDRVQALDLLYSASGQRTLEQPCATGGALALRGVAFYLETCLNTK
jgi:hypothetical protein